MTTSLHGPRARHPVLVTIGTLFVLSGLAGTTFLWCSSYDTIMGWLDGAGRMILRFTNTPEDAIAALVVFLFSAMLFYLVGVFLCGLGVVCACYVALLTQNTPHHSEARTCHSH